MKKILLTIVILAVVLFSWVLLRNRGDVVVDTSVFEVLPTSTPLVYPKPTASPSPVISNNTVTYINSGYLPSTLTIKKGQTVTWKNNASSGMWTASAIHPTHSAYPTTGGCLGSTFDACVGVASGGMWSFKFDIVGTWKYHNHSSPAHTGTVVVE